MVALILKQRQRPVVKKIDYIIIFCLSIFLGIFLVSQYYANKEYDKVIQPENNEILAVEVARLTKSNSDLRTEVKELTNTLDNYRKANTSRADIYNQYSTDNNRLDLINGIATYSGQGVMLQVNGKLRGSIKINLNEEEDSVKEKALNEPNVNKYLLNNEVVKIIVVKNRIVNIIVK